MFSSLASCSSNLFLSAIKSPSFNTPSYEINFHILNHLCYIMVFHMSTLCAACKYVTLSTAVIYEAVWWLHFSSLVHFCVSHLRFMATFSSQIYLQVYKGKSVSLHIRLCVEICAWTAGNALETYVFYWPVHHHHHHHYHQHALGMQYGYSL
jgi:hypothetical protein